MASEHTQWHQNSVVQKFQTTGDERDVLQNAGTISANLAKTEDLVPKQNGKKGAKDAS